MTKTKLFPISVIFILLMTSSKFHIETVVTYKIYNSGNKLFVSASMEKSYASILVMTKSEMVTSKNRGVQLNKIVKENTTFNINGVDYLLKFDSAKVNKENLELKYYIENIPSNIYSLTMKNDVIVGADDLAIVNAYVKIKSKRNKVLRFNKKNNSRTITY